MKIEIWSDVMCPFCYIGKRNFEAAQANILDRKHLTRSLQEVINYYGAIEMAAKTKLFIVSKRLRVVVKGDAQPHVVSRSSTSGV